jgi:hypothetical protein
VRRPFGHSGLGMDDTSFERFLRSHRDVTRGDQHVRHRSHWLARDRL